MTLTSAQFKEKIKDTLIVQFSATWCGPCKALTRTIETIQAELTHPVYKMDIDEHPDLTSALSIRSVPVLIRFEQGEEIKRMTGNRSAADIKSLVNS